MNAHELEYLHRSLADHCRRELPLSQGLGIVASELEDRSLRAAVRRVRASLDDGACLEDAWAQGAPAMPPLYGPLLDAAAKAGELPAALDQVAAHAAMSSAVRERLRRAMFAPMLTAVVCLVFGLLAAVLAGPGIAELTQRATGRAPWLLSAIGIGVLVGVVVGALWLTRWRNPLAQGRFAMPVFGPLRLDALRASVASTLALLVGRHVPLPVATEQMTQTVAPGVAQDAMRRAHEAATDGASLRTVLSESGLFERSTLWLVEAAEGSSDTPRALEDMADVYRRRVDRGIDRAGVVARPVVEMVVGIAVLLFAYAYAAPFLDSLNWLRGA